MRTSRLRAIIGATALLIISAGCFFVVIWSFAALFATALMALVLPDAPALMTIFGLEFSPWTGLLVSTVIGMITFAIGVTLLELD